MVKMCHLNASQYDLIQSVYLSYQLHICAVIFVTGWENQYDLIQSLSLDWQNKLFLYVIMSYQLNSTIPTSRYPKVFAEEHGHIMPILSKMIKYDWIKSLRSIL